jgi:glycosyltransferase involved in cell wall biosynthesis
MGYRYKFTVFTPVFNGASTIHRVYESLKAQTFRDFEWLVIDDGSTDGTGELIKQWQKEADFPIRYFYQENQGKHIAFNRAVEMAEGELFLPIDQDDATLPEALERLLYHWDSIPPEMRSSFSGVTCLCQDEEGNIVGDKFPQDVMDSDELEMPHKYRVRGEKWGFHRTEILRQFPFPHLPKVGYMPESIVWNAIALQYKKRFINEPLRIFYSLGPRPASLTTLSHRNPARHAIGRRLYHQENLNKYIRWARYDPLDFLKSAVNYIRFSFHLRLSITHQWAGLTNWTARLLYLLAFPGGLGLYLSDRLWRG